ncbi:hypothetical protein GGR51DRAFT_565348 [Nemania sp. FL0031]|nr:hypothetical protein GGR51DRAFT_565348 [Nemania sp. FL0031]
MAPTLPTPAPARHLNAETEAIPCTSIITSTSKVSPPLRTVPSQTVSRPLTTIFTPPPLCENRYYVEAKANGYFTERGIFSDTGDRLYQPCQPDPKAHDNHYSPGACPSNMEIATVLSSASDGTTDMTGFVWDLQSCYSMVPTSTTVLVAPTVSTLDEYVSVSQIRAWHPPVMAVWQTTDLSLFPSDVMSQKSNIVEYGWPPHPTSLTTPTPFAGNRSEEPPNNDPDTGTLSVPAILAIGVGSVLITWFVALLFSPPRERREPSRSNSTVYTGPQDSQAGYTWRVEVGPPPPDQLDLQDIRSVCDRQGKEEQAATEIGSGSALTPASNHGMEEDADITSPISSHA